MINQVPTTVITGLLGAGKTTAILNLLQQKNNSERWVVVVNEFGQVGIDGAVLTANTKKPDKLDNKLIVHEIPGGCVCCTAGMQFRVAIPRLLRELRPDRLIIEPSGVAQLGSVLDILRSEWLSSVLDLRATICLLDASRFNLDLWSNSTVYREQLSNADIVLVNKCDLVTPSQLQDLHNFLQQLPLKQTIISTNYAHCEASLLDYAPTQTEFKQLHVDSVLPNNCGWIFPAEYYFSQSKLRAWFLQLSTQIQRAKGIFRLSSTKSELFNYVNARLSSQPIDYNRDSRIELIAQPNSIINCSSLQRDLLATKRVRTTSPTSGVSGSVRS